MSEDRVISFKRISAEGMPWDKLKEFEAANIFQSWPWIKFLADFLGAEPVIAVILSDGIVQGYFMGLIEKRLGLRILGSPFRDWNTYFMGFNLMPGISYSEVLQAFPHFAFDELNCHFLMIIDVNLKESELIGLPYHIRKITNFVIDLTQSQADLFAKMKGNSCRTSIRRTIKKGVVIEETNNLGFADEYYAQYLEMNARKSLAPYYNLDFVRQMIAYLLPTGNLLMLRARTSEGVCIATHIALVFNKVAVAWGSASRTDYLTLRPNELIYWYAMKRAKSMGIEVFQLADGVKQFKQKLGAFETPVFRLMKARCSLLYFPFFAAISINERFRLWKRRGIGRRFIRSCR
jgi:hypothetical protein